MMVREDLIEGAVSFLQDPSIASAPLEQRIAFLKSKNLTQDEVDASLARVGQAPSAPPSSAPPPGNYYQQRAPPQYGYQQQQAYWPQQAPPELPRRDWRDYFIMATVTAGLGSALYFTAKRYIVPLIAPPTPPQLEQDKASIDLSFEKAFTLLDQLATDTKELKDAEQQRTERLDKALSEVESVIGRLKEANEERDREGKRMANDLREIEDAIPRAIEKEREGTDQRLVELAKEMKSLKMLVGNRMQGSGRTTPIPTSSAGIAQQASMNGTPETNGPSATNGASADAPTEEERKTPTLLPERSASASPYSTRVLGGKAGIPDWQRVAKQKSEEAKKGVSEGASQPSPIAASGTVEEVEASA